MPPHSGQRVASVPRPLPQIPRSIYLARRRPDLTQTVSFCCDLPKDLAAALAPRARNLLTVPAVSQANLPQGGPMPSTRNPGRVAGLWYLLLVFGGPIRLIYIPSKLFVHGNAAPTASNIPSHACLFRFAIVTNPFTPVILISPPLPLY